MAPGETALPPIVATWICCIGIAGLFWLDRSRRDHTSVALWIPQVWFLLACSRPLSGWLNMSAPGSDTTGLASQISDGSATDRAVGALLIFLGLVVLFNRGRKVAKSLRDSWPIMLFFAFCLASVLWSDFPGVAFKRLIRDIGDWVMVLIIWTDPLPISALMRLLKRLTFTLIPLSIVFAKYYPFGRNYSYWSGGTEYTGVTGDKNALGAICLLFGIASVWQVLMLLKERPRSEYGRKMFAQLAILAMIAYLLKLADSVTSLSCLFIAIFALLALRIRMVTRRPVMVHLLVLSLIAVPGCVALLGAMPGALQAMGRDSSLTDRTLIWSAVLRLVPNHWVGAGYGSFWIGPRLDDIIKNVTHVWIPNQAHDGYLEIYANLGLLGVGLLGFVITWGYSRIIRAWRQRLPASDLMLAYFLIGVVSNISEAAFFREMIPVWLFFTIAVSMPPIQGVTVHEGKPASRVSRSLNIGYWGADSRSASSA